MINAKLKLYFLYRRRDDADQSHPRGEISYTDEEDLYFVNFFLSHICVCVEKFGIVAYTDEQRKLVYLQLVLYPLLVFLS